MTNEYVKFAVYWVPKRHDALARFGTSWTGWCADNGELRERGCFDSLTVSPQALTRELSRHGLHGVIKAPFALARGRSRFALETGLGRAVTPAVACPMPRFEIGVVDGRVALVADSASTPDKGLIDLIGRVDAAIAPLETAPEAEAKCACAKTRVVQLPATAAHRFHLPLTDPMPTIDDAFRVAAELKDLVAPFFNALRQLSDIALMGDPGAGRRLRVLERYDLRSTPPRRATEVLPVSGPDILIPLEQGGIAI